VRMGGGETRSLDSVTPMEVPARCTGPYWIAGSQIESVSLEELPNHSHVASLLRALRAQGYTLDEPEESRAALLYPEPGIVYQLDEHSWLHLHLFSSERAARVRADAIAQDLPHAAIDWVAPPHFYRFGRVIVLYLGDDQVFQQALAQHCQLVAGPLFESSMSTPAPLESLTVLTAASLTIEEYAIVSATVDTPTRFEFLDRIPEDVLSRRAAWRGFDAERRLSRLNETLSPFDCRLTANENIEWRAVSYDFYCEDRKILSNLRHVWPVSVNGSGTDFAFVVENAPNASPTYLLVQKDVVTPLLFPDRWNYVAPVYRGDQLLTVERLDDGRFAVTQGDEVLYTYADKAIRSDRPIKRLLVDGEDWILEARGEVIVNGKSLNRRLDVDEIFHYVILQGQPLFFFERGGEVRVSYGGETLPVVYDKVIHYQCCEPASFNVASNEHMLWFYALRDGVWHYVEMGVFE